MRKLQIRFRLTIKEWTEWQEFRVQGMDEHFADLITKFPNLQQLVVHGYLANYVCARRTIRFFTDLLNKSLAIPSVDIIMDGVQLHDIGKIQKMAATKNRQNIFSRHGIPVKFLLEMDM